MWCFVSTQSIYRIQAPYNPKYLVSQGKLTRVVRQPEKVKQGRIASPNITACTPKSWYAYYE